MDDLKDFVVGDFLIRPALSQIVRGDETVHVEPRSLDVLAALARNGREVSLKQELIRSVWGDAFVSDEVLTHAIWDLRRAFGDSANDPRYIQTIPKRGYRLIATVRESAPERREVERPRSPKPARLAWTALALALLGAIGLIGSRWPYSGAARGSPSRVVEVVGLPSPDNELETSQLAEQLASRLTGSSGLDVIEPDECSLRRDRWCLTVGLFELDQTRAIQVRLFDADRKASAFAPPPQPLDAPLAAIDELADLATAYFQFLDLPYSSHADLANWYDLRRHDVRAVRDFLIGVGYIYQHEVGGGEPLGDAVARDPGFVAPRIWRIPSAIVDGDSTLVAEDLASLAQLHADANPFEQSMIQWVEALAAGERRVQLRHLRAALRAQPDNRHARFWLALTHRGLGRVDKAFALFDSLVREGWVFGGAYATAAECALLLDQPLEAKRILESALALEESKPPVPADPVALALLELLAIYQAEPAVERTFAERLALRIEEMAPEPFEYDRSPYASRLAAMARSEGRTQVAERLAEFSDS